MLLIHEELTKYVCKSLFIIVYYIMFSNKYDYIKDPVSNKLIKSDSKKGKQIINSYIDEFNGGGIVNTLIEYVSSKPPSPHTENYGQFLAYVLPEQLDAPISITSKFRTFEDYIYYKISYGYLFELAQLFKDFVTYILQLKLIHYYERQNLKYNPTKHNEVVKKIFNISDIVHAHSIKYEIFNDTDINSIFIKKYGESFKIKSFKIKFKKEELRLLNLESNENPQIKLALKGINQIKILMKNSLSGMKQLVEEFEDKYRVQGDQNFSQYEKNHGVRSLKAKVHKKLYSGKHDDISKFNQDWKKIAKNNVKKLFGENQQPICVTYNKDKNKYDIAVDYKNCFDKVEKFFEDIEKDTEKIKKINEKLNYRHTEQAIYSKKIFKKKNFDDIYR